MENKWKEKRQTKQEIKYLEKQKEELSRIINEIKEENSKFISDERMQEIIEGKQGRLEKAKILSEDLRKDTMKRYKCNTIKNLAITLNILILLAPYALVGGISYGIMEKCNIPPYHQNTNKSYSTVTEYKNNLGESFILDKEQIEKYGKDSMVIYSPWEETENGYSRNVFKTDSCKKEDFDNLEKVNPLDIITAYSFDESEKEETKTLPEGENDFLVETTRTYKDKEHPIVKENSKGQIFAYSIIHLGISALVGSAIYAGIKTILKKKNKKYILEDKINAVDMEKSLLKTAEEKETLKQKIKNLKR